MDAVDTKKEDSNFIHFKDQVDENAEIIEAMFEEKPGYSFGSYKWDCSGQVKLATA